MRGPIRLEAGRGYVLASCVDCPPWRRMPGTRRRALLLAADHAALVHGDGRLAKSLRELAARQERDTPTD